MTTRRSRRPGHPCSTSFWARTFDAARLNGEWTRVGRFYTRKTAAQIASDITCSHKRAPGTRRLKGVTEGEVWEARWAPALDGPPGDYRIEIRLVEAAGRSTTVTAIAPASPELSSAGLTSAGLTYTETSGHTPTSQAPAA